MVSYIAIKRVRYTWFPAPLEGWVGSYNTLTHSEEITNPKVSVPSRGMDGSLHVIEGDFNTFGEEFPAPLEVWVVSYQINQGDSITVGLVFVPSRGIGGFLPYDTHGFM